MGEDEGDADQDDEADFELDETSAAGRGRALNTPLVKEMNRIIKALIYIKTWPKNAKPKGGNPFAVPLIRGETTSVPDSYFDKIANPLDLSTIKKRIDQDYYVTFEQFAKDVTLVASNAIEYNTQGTGQLMAIHLSECVRKELDKGQKALGL